MHFLDVWVSSVLRNQFMPAAPKRRLTQRYDLFSEISITNMAGFILALPLVRLPRFQRCLEFTREMMISQLRDFVYHVMCKGCVM